MHVASLFVLTLAAFAAPAAHALRMSASSTLTRLSQRLAAAESALSELRLSSGASASAIAVTAPGPTPTSQYTFDLQSYNDGSIVPADAYNIGFMFDSSRSSWTVQRGASKYYPTSYLSLPQKLSSSFTLSIWFNWDGTGTTEQHIIESSDSSFQLYFDASGHLNCVVNGVKQTDVNQVISGLTWYFAAVTVDAGSSTFKFFTGNQKGVQRINAVTAKYPGTASSLVVFNYGAVPDPNKAFTGYVDSISLWNYAIGETDVSDVWWGTNNAAPPTGRAPTAPSYGYFWGHFSQATVTFQTRVAKLPAGQVQVTLTPSDIDVAYGDEIRLHLNGCGGNATNGYVTLSDGTQASWAPLKYQLSLFPPAQSPTVVHTNSMSGVQYQVAIPQGSSYTFTLPNNLVQIANPTSIAVSASDSSWVMCQVFSSQQIHQLGCSWVPILITPATIIPGI